MKILFFAEPSPDHLKTHSKIIKYLLIAKELEVISNISPAFTRTAHTATKSRFTFIKGTDTQRVEAAIVKSRATIIESSIPSLELGVYSSFCICMHKPILLLSKTRDYHDLFNSNYFYTHKYGNTEYFAKPINNFLKHINKQELSQRFNLTLTEEQKDYLKSKAEFNKNTITNHLRNLIEEDMLKK
ncbi:hypothetical protein JW978_04460 [Candidatus Dojkabacteria bacterium]|nr:hypothetical protein [Candidatus Dojkabacteria bacterium]